jgi:hypothetical protein
MHEKSGVPRGRVDSPSETRGTERVRRMEGIAVLGSNLHGAFGYCYMSVGDAERDRMEREVGTGICTSTAPDTEMIDKDSRLVGNQTMMGGELNIEFGSAVIMTVRGGRGVWVSPIVMGASGTIS